MAYIILIYYAAIHIKLQDDEKFYRQIRKNKMTRNKVSHIYHLILILICTMNLNPLKALLILRQTTAKLYKLHS